jgi:hypothetical protein
MIAQTMRNNLNNNPQPSCLKVKADHIFGYQCVSVIYMFLGRTMDVNINN